MNVRRRDACLHASLHFVNSGAWRHAPGHSYFFILSVADTNPGGGACFIAVYSEKKQWPIMPGGNAYKYNMNTEIT
ncbi:MAG TPA: hypothetical protein VK492_05420 [Chitinophagaceae bacterium]|nr:hypothetical protein [Chitinophagaceae bacterium]